MIRVGILGDIGSGKSFIANKFGHPVFSADKEVSKIYRTNKGVYFKLKKKLPKYIYSFPVRKTEITKAILANNQNLNKIVTIVHKEVRRKLKLFLKKNKRKKIIILDIPLLLENKINNKKDVLVFIESKKSEIYKRLKRRKNFNINLFQKFKKIQLKLDFKKKKSHYIIKNNFTKKSVNKEIKIILNKIYK